MTRHPKNWVEFGRGAGSLLGYGITGSTDRAASAWSATLKMITLLGIRSAKQQRSRQMFNLGLILSPTPSILKDGQGEQISAFLDPPKVSHKFQKNLRIKFPANSTTYKTTLPKTHATQKTHANFTIERTSSHPLAYGGTKPRDSSRLRVA
jgi:hypothetical protein